MSHSSLVRTPKPSFTYRLVSSLLVFPVFRLLFRGSTTGNNRVPMQGPLVVVANHGSHLDPPLLGHAWGALWPSWRRRNCSASRCWDG